MASTIRFPGNGGMLKATLPFSLTHLAYSATFLILWRHFACNAN